MKSAREMFLKGAEKFNLPVSKIAKKSRLFSYSVMQERMFSMITKTIDVPKST
jgi:hypothetical protein